MRIGGGIVACNRNVDPHINYDRSIQQRSEEGAVAAVAGAVVAGVDQAGARAGGDSSAQSGVSVTAMTTDAGHLNSALINVHIVRLVGVGTGIRSRHGDV